MVAKKLSDDPNLVTYQRRKPEGRPKDVMRQIGSTMQSLRKQIVDIFQKRGEKKSHAEVMRIAGDVYKGKKHLEDI